MVYRIRIPQTPRRTWFRRRSAEYRVRDAEDPGPRARRLRGRGHGRELRAEMVDQARIRRSWPRWILLLATWGALLWAALLEPLHVSSALHLVALLLALVAWPAAFSLNRANRGFSSFLLLAGGAAYALLGGSPGPALTVGLAAAGLLLGAIRPDAEAT